MNRIRDFLDWYGKFPSAVRSGIALITICTLGPVALVLFFKWISFLMYLTGLMS